MTGWLKSLAVIALVVLLAGCQTIGGWFGRDSGPEPAELVDFEPSLEVEQVWSVNAGRGGNRSRPQLRPYVSDGLVWVGDHRGGITATGLESGRVEERFSVDEPLSAGPAVYDDLILVGTFDGRLVAMDRDTGNVRWRARLSSEVLAYPVVHDDVVVARSIDGRVFGFDASNGTRLWVHDRSVPLLTLRGNSDPLARAGRAYIGYEDGMVVALQVSDGSVLWEQRVGVPEGRTELERLSDIDGPMAIVGSELYAVSYRGRMAGLALESGRLMWVRDIASHSGLALARTRLAVTDRDDAISLIDRRDGSTEWRDDRLSHRGVQRPEFVGSHLVAVDAEGYMHWYDIDSGEFAARSRFGRSGAAAAPVVVGRNVIVLDEDGGLSAWRTRD